MNKNSLICAITITMLFWCSCWGIKANLNKDDLSWMEPYKIGDTLVFASSFGLLDTCYITGNNLYYSDYKPNGVPTKYTSQIGEIIYQKRGTFDSLERGKIIIVQKDSPDSPASKAINYCNNYFSATAKYQRLNGDYDIRGQTYSDLWLVSDQDTSWKPNKKEEFDYMPKVLYWSKSSGLVKYITYSGEVWELKEKRRLYRKI